jgi:cytochrome b involved in lipid metabolism
LSLALRKVKYFIDANAGMTTVSNVITKAEIQAFATKLDQWAHGQNTAGLNDEERLLLEILIARAEHLKDDSQEELIIVDKSIKDATLSALDAFSDREKGKRLDDEEVRKHVEKEKLWIEGLRLKRGKDCYLWRRSTTTPPK